MGGGGGGGAPCKLHGLQRSAVIIMMAVTDIISQMIGPPKFYQSNPE